MKKKGLLLFACILLLFGFSACNKSNEAQETASTVETTAEKETVKIGLSHVSDAVPICHDAYRMIRAAAAALGDVEVIILDDEFNPEKQIANVENLISAGCDAISVCNPSEAIVPKLMQMTEENEVGFGLFFRKINDPDIKKAAVDSEYFVGYTHENELNNGYQLGKALAEKGAEKAVIINWNRGDPTAEERYAGYAKAFKEFNVEILAEQWDISTGDAATTAMQNFLSAYPELDTVVVVGGGGQNTLGVIAALRNAGRTEDTLFATTDFVPDQFEMLEKGEIDCISGGHWVDPFFQFMLMYNWAKGNSLTDEFADIIVNYMFITSLEMQKQYDQYVGGDVLPYSDDEVRNLAVNYNPDMSYEMLLEWASNYSIDDVISRHE